MFFDLGFALQGFQGQNKWRNKHARFQHNTDKEREKNVRCWIMRFFNVAAVMALHFPYVPNLYIPSARWP